MDKEYIKEIREIKEILVHFSKKMDQGFKDVRSEMKQGLKDVRSEMAQEFKNIRSEMKQGLKDVRSEMATDLARGLLEVRAEMNTGFVEIRNDIRDLREGLEAVENIALSNRGFAKEIDILFSETNKIKKHIGLETTY